MNKGAPVSPAKFSRQVCGIDPEWTADELAWMAENPDTVHSLYAGAWGLEAYRSQEAGDESHAENCWQEAASRCRAIMNTEKLWTAIGKLEGLHMPERILNEIRDLHQDNDRSDSLWQWYFERRRSDDAERER